MRSEQDELQKIVAQADISDEWKKIFQETFRVLSKRNDAVLNEIRERVLREDGNLRKDWSSKWHVVTALAASENCSDMAGFRSIIGKQEDIEEELFEEAQYIDVSGDYFLECSYEEMDALCATESADAYPYEGCIDVKGERRAFRYRLVRDLRFVSRERLLFCMADLYHIKVPVLFSPYARRAVKIQLPREESAVADLLREHDAGREPYRFEKNHLADKILSGKRLLWNISTEVIALPPYNSVQGASNSFFAPYGDQEIYRYEFAGVKDAAFICPDYADLEAVIEAEKDLEQQKIIVVTKRQLSAPCISMRILPVGDDAAKYYGGEWGKTAFSNREAQRSMPDAKERLRTQGDVERALYALSMPEHGFSCDFRGISPTARKDQDVLRRYPQEAAYGTIDVPREQVLYRKWRSLPFAYIAFSGGDRFLNDYAEVVLSFLGRRFPDFQWVGVR